MTSANQPHIQRAARELETLPPYPMASTETAHAHAHAALAAGNRRFAYLLAHAVLDAEPDCGWAWKLAGALAAESGLWREAEAWLERAQAIDESADIARLVATASQRRAQEKPPAAPRYLLIKSWGHGFWSDVLHVLEGLLSAEITGRTPIVWWGANSRYGTRTAREHFGDFFAPVSEARLESIEANAKLGVAPEPWRRNNLRVDGRDKHLRRDEANQSLRLLAATADVVVHEINHGLRWLLRHVPPDHPAQGRDTLGTARWLAARHLRPRANILAAAERFLAAHGIATQPFIAVHARGLDKRFEEPRLHERHAELRARTDALAASLPDLPIVLLTDDARVPATFASHGRRLLMPDTRRLAGDHGLHFASPAEGRQLGEEILRDTLIAARAAHFVGGRFTNVSVAVSILRDWDANALHLVGDEEFARYDFTSCLPRPTR